MDSYRALIATCLALVLAGCAETPTLRAAGAPVPEPTTPAGIEPAAGTGPAAGTEPAPVVPPFVGESRPANAADVPRSWRAGCPVGPDQLSVLRLGHWDFDGHPRVGTLVVHRDAAEKMIVVFGSLYQQRFPIRRMEPVDVYDGSDDASMAADNTSAFNCRNATSSGPPRWSQHAYGQAIDVNPVENPYLFGGSVLPPAGAAYVRRTPYRPGMAVEGGVLVNAFAAVGWSWGGRWRSSTDYQHFSSTGR